MPRAITWILVGASVVSAVFLIASVPPHSDEFVHYRPIYCEGSADAIRLPNDYCFDWQLRPPGAPRFFQLRAYRYIGFTPSLLYLPTHLSWPDYRAARATGIASLLLFAFLLARLARIPGWAAALLALFNLPLAYQMIFDTGPVAFQLVTVLIVAWGLPRLRRPWQGLLLGLTLFVALDHKPVFAVVAPALALLCVASLEEEREALRRHLIPWLRSLGLAVAAFAVPAALLLVSIDHKGHRYFQTILGHGTLTSGEDPGQVIERALDFRPLWIDFGNVSHRVYFSSPEWDPATVLYWLLAAGLVAGGAWVAERGARLRMALCLAATLVAAGAVFVVRDAWAGHHLVLALPFGLALLAFAARALLAAHARVTVGLLAAMALCHVGIGAALPGRTPHAGFKLEEPHPEGILRGGEIALLEEIRRPENAERFFYVVTQWGFIDFATLYGGAEVSAFDLQQLAAKHYERRVDELAQTTGRRPAFLVRGKPPDYIRRIYPQMRRTFPSDDASLWQMWVP